METLVPTLREVQAAFARGVLAPSGFGVARNEIVARVVADGIAPERRLAIYRNNVHLSLRRVLEGTFPASRRLLGAERFAEIARAFIHSAPPERPQLMTYGADFPVFLERSVPAAVAHVADVARLEWARQEAYHAADARPLSATDLAAVPVARYPELRFSLHPTLRAVRSAGPVFTLWQAASANPAASALHERDPAALDDGSAQQVLVLRPEMTVTTRAVAAADLLLLEGLGEGLPLAGAAARAQATDPDFDLEAALVLHLAGGSFAGCR